MPRLTVRFSDDTMSAIRDAADGADESTWVRGVVENHLGVGAEPLVAPEDRRRLARIDTRSAEAVRLVDGGERRVAVAERLGVSRQRVDQWIKAYRDGGLDALQ